MRPLSGSSPNSPQGNLERAGTVAADLRHGAVDIIPKAITVDLYGRARMDREARGITQPRCDVQLLQNGGCRPRYLLRPGEGAKNVGCLQKEVIAYSDDFKTAVVEFACEKVDLRRWAVQENRPARLGAICRCRNRRV